MMNDRAELAAVQAATLDDLLSRWHHKCKEDNLNKAPKCSPNFRDVPESRSFDTIEEVHEDQFLRRAMNAMNTYILGDKWTAEGGMDEPWRAAILISARNCYTGHSVWMSPRLPTDPMERARIVGEARGMLMKRLVSCGVM